MYFDFWKLQICSLKNKTNYLCYLIQKISDKEGKLLTPCYVNKNAQANGDHEVHKLTCDFLPEPQNRKYLGQFDNCAEAVQEAKKSYKQSNGCFYCCGGCHTQ